MMRDQLGIQEQMDCWLESRDEELWQLRSQSQEDGAQLAALSLQVQELIALVKERFEVVERDLEEVNGCFDCHWGEISRLKIREKEAKEKVEELGGFIIGAGHDAKIFKDQLDCMEDSWCWCGRTPSEVGEEFILSEDKVSGPLYPKLSTCFEGARLTQLVQLVTAGRLFPCHEGRVDP